METIFFTPLTLTLTSDGAQISSITSICNFYTKIKQQQHQFTFKLLFLILELTKTELALQRNIGKTSDRQHWRRSWQVLENYSHWENFFSQFFWSNGAEWEGISSGQERCQAADQHSPQPVWTSCSSRRRSARAKFKVAARWTEIRQKSCPVFVLKISLWWLSWNGLAYATCWLILAARLWGEREVGPMHDVAPWKRCQRSSSPTCEPQTLMLHYKTHSKINLQKTIWWPPNDCFTNLFSLTVKKSFQRKAEVVFKHLFQLPVWLTQIVTTRMKQ